MSYFGFLLVHRRFLAFGFVLTAFSSFGQTFFIALFSGEIRAAFDLGHGGFGTVYSLATLASATCLMWIGRRIDDVDLRVWCALIVAGLAAACWLMAWSPGLPVVALALFGLRFFGQGLMSHAAGTAMARYFEGARGRAVSVSALGYSAGEAVLPALAVALIAAAGWRAAWGLIGLVLLVVALPLVQWFLRGHGERHRALIERHARGGGLVVAASWSRGQVLRDPVFYLLLPTTLASSFILTGLFFHQVHLAQTKGWSLAWLASCFVGWAVAALVATLATGPLVDRLGASRMVPFTLLPLATGLLVLAAGDHRLVALVYLVLAGVTQGMHFTTQGALWAELYGVRHLGAIRAMTSGLGVFATALAPVSMGLLIDAGVSMERIALGCALWIAGAVALVTRALARYRARDPG